MIHQLSRSRREKRPQKTRATPPWHNDFLVTATNCIRIHSEMEKMMHDGTRKVPIRKIPGWSSILRRQMDINVGSILKGPEP
jgi:hypothetical protein